MFSVTVIGTLGGPASRAFAIDQFRRVVGDAEAAPNSDNHALLFAGAAQDLGVLPLINPFSVPGAPEFRISTARGISPLTGGGLVVVGFSGVFSFAGTGIDRAFIWTGASLVEIGTLMPVPGLPGSFLGNSQAYGANSNGLVVGASDIAALGPAATPLRRAFVYDLSTRQMGPLPTLWPAQNTPGTYLGNCEARGINDQGQIVGFSDTGQVDAQSNMIRHAFVYDLATQQMRDLGTLLSMQGAPVASAGNSEARAINRFGQIVGVSDGRDTSGAGVQRAFLYDGGSLRDLRTLLPDPNNPNGFLGNSEANGINDNGVVVGASDTGQVDPNGDQIQHGVLFDPAIRRFEDLNDPPLPGGATIVQATGVNNAVDVCGQGVDATGSNRGLLLFI
jgi:probable HAF family extracellular repeat protein